ncbi:hypothetical protein ILYODFUR_031485, partial [Ilyodon furcidens]
MFGFFMLLGQCAVSLSRDPTLSFTVRAGDDITLSCENVAENERRLGVVIRH